MKLTAEQEAAVRQWVEEGARLPDVQKRLREEFNLTLTYLEARLLAGDLGLTFVSDEPAKPEAADEPEGEVDGDGALQEDTTAPAGGVSVSLDMVTRAQAIVSGKATFSDGTTVSWYVDQMGRLGMEPPTPGYRPPEADIPTFQNKLQQLLQSQGF